MNQIIIQHPNDTIIEYVKNKYRPKDKYSRVNHYVFVGNPIKVFAFTGSIYDHEAVDVLPIETIELLEQALALANVGLTPVEIKTLLFGDES